MQNEVIELVGSVDIAEDVHNIIKTVGVRGLDFEKAKELGLFQRISNLLCASHASIMAAYRIYGGAATIINDIGARRNDISKAMNDFEKSFMRFVSFWTDYYAHGQAGREVNEESEALFRNIMDWAQLPLDWQLGESQRKDDNDIEVAIRIEGEDKTYTFRKSTIRDELVGESEESWCVTEYDTKKLVQTTVEENMDKASAMMVAKRMSSDNKDNIYTASVIRDYMQRMTDITPFKAYKNNETVGGLTKRKK